jgi:hypothetical protein
VAARKTTDLTALTTPTVNTLVPAVDLTEALPSNQNKKLTLSDLTKGLSAATTGAAGVVQLSTSTSSTSSSLAATPSAVKSAYDLATAALARSGGTMTGAITFAGAQPTATTSAANIVQLSDSISSTSTTLAATANAVKTAYDRATNGLVTAGTVQNSTSGTSIDFTGLPAGVKRVTVIFNGVSTTGASDILVQLGVSSTPTASGYAGGQSIFSWGSGVVSATSTAGIPIYNNLATYAFYGQMVLLNITGNTWVASGTFTTSTGLNACVMSGGSIALGGSIGMVRITTASGTPTFDAGSLNVLYES